MPPNQLVCLSMSSVPTFVLFFLSVTSTTSLSHSIVSFSIRLFTFFYYLSSSISYFFYLESHLNLVKSPLLVLPVVDALSHASIVSSNLLHTFSTGFHGYQLSKPSLIQPLLGTLLTCPKFLTLSPDPFPPPAPVPSAVESPRYALIPLLYHQPPLLPLNFKTIYIGPLVQLCLSAMPL